LEIGNFMNEGSSRGNAFGFKISSLLKLEETKTTNNTEMEENEMENDTNEIISDETENQEEININDEIYKKRIIALENRCREMRSLKDGWYYGEGKSYSDEMLSTVDSVIRRLLDQGVPPPIFGPSPDGSVEIEWKGIHVILSKNDSENFFKFDVLTVPDEKENIFTKDEEFIVFMVDMN